MTLPYWNFKVWKCINYILFKREYFPSVNITNYAKSEWERSNAVSPRPQYNCQLALMAACWFQKQQTSRLSDNVFSLSASASPSFKINLTRRKINFHQEIYAFDTPTTRFTATSRADTLQQRFSECQCLAPPEAAVRWLRILFRASFRDRSRWGGYRLISLKISNNTV